jgi:SAM-dependent methyltransferase
MRDALEQVRQGDVVLDLGCRHTRDLAVRAAHVVALHPDREALLRAQEQSGPLNNVSWLVGDGRSLLGVEDEAVDAALADLRRLGPKRALAYVEELARVLRPGGWATFLVNTAPSRPAAPEGTSRRDLFRGLARPAPRPSTPVPLEALGAVATTAGLTLDDIDGALSEHTTVRATRSPAS